MEGGGEGYGSSESWDRYLHTNCQPFNHYTHHRGRGAAAAAASPTERLRNLVDGIMDPAVWVPWARKSQAQERGGRQEKYGILQLSTKDNL